MHLTRSIFLSDFSISPWMPDRILEDLDFTGRAFSDRTFSFHLNTAWICKCFVFMVLVRDSHSLGDLPDAAGAAQWPVSQGDNGGQSDMDWEHVQLPDALNDHDFGQDTRKRNLQSSKLRKNIHSLQVWTDQMTLKTRLDASWCPQPRHGLIGTWLKQLTWMSVEPLTTL